MKTLLDHDDFNVLKARMAATIAAGLFANEHNNPKLIPGYSVATADTILVYCDIQDLTPSPQPESK